MPRRAGAAHLAWLFVHVELGHPDEPDMASFGMHVALTVAFASNLVVPL